MNSLQFGYVRHTLNRQKRWARTERVKPAMEFEAVDHDEWRREK